MEGQRMVVRVLRAPELLHQITRCCDVVDGK